MTTRELIRAKGADTLIEKIEMRGTRRFAGRRTGPEEECELGGRTLGRVGGEVRIAHMLSPSSGATPLILLSEIG